MNVLFASSSFPCSQKDWRSVFVRHQLEGLARLSKVSLAVWAPKGQVDQPIRFCLQGDDERWLAELMEGGGLAHLLRSKPATGVLKAAILLYRLRRCYRENANADLFHINWMQNALSMPRGKTPLVLTALGSDLQLLRLPGMVPMIRRAIKARPVTICPNAEWMEAPLLDAFGDLARIQTVPFGIEKCWYEVRRRPDPEPQWLVVSRLTKAKLGPLFEWCEPLFKNQRRKLILIGPMQEQIVLPEWIAYVGAETPARLCARWFPTATGLLSLSTHAEGRPQVMLEAMASGLPLVASDNSAHRDIIMKASSGRTVVDAQQLAATLQDLEQPEVNSRMGEQGRHWVSGQLGDWDACARRYLAVYQDLQERHFRD